MDILRTGLIAIAAVAAAKWASKSVPGLAGLAKVL